MAVSLVPSHARWSFPAGSASLTQFQFVSVNSTGQVITPAASGVFAYVLDDAPSLIGATVVDDMPTDNYIVGVNYGVVLSTVCVQKVICAATMNPGSPVMTDASGHAIAYVSPGIILGYTMTSSTSGALVTIGPPA